MNYKNIFAFILLIFAQVVVATDTHKPGWHPGKGATTVQVADAYARYCEKNNIEPTLIIGSGRGEMYSEEADDNRNFAAIAYAEPEKYLTVNCPQSESRTKPDIAADIMSIGTQFGINTYKKIILENLPKLFAASKKGILGAYGLLREKGQIISPSMPLLQADESLQIGKHFVVANIYNNMAELRVDKAAYEGYRMRRDHKIQDEKQMKATGQSNINEETCAIYEAADLSLFNNTCGTKLLTFFGLNPREADIQFSIVTPGSDMWPKRYCMGGQSEKRKIAMIITKKKKRSAE